MAKKTEEKATGASTWEGSGSGFPLSCCTWMVGLVFIFRCPYVHCL